MKKIGAALLSCLVLLTAMLSISMTAFAQTSETPKLADGNYYIEVTLAGADGEATVKSPTKMENYDGKMLAEVVMDSKNYDYMLVNGEKYNRVNKKGKAKFAIYVPTLDEPFTVVLNSTETDPPKELTYTLTFSSATAEKVETEVSSEQIASVVCSLLGGLLLLVMIFLIFLFIRDQRKKAKAEKKRREDRLQ